MSIVPLITFKAGICSFTEYGVEPRKVTPDETPGYVYLYSEDDLIHFCWRNRNAPVDEPSIDLVMVPTDGQFVPYAPKDRPTAKTNGRIWILKFSSSSARYFFWMQSKPQGSDPSWFSPRDKKIGQIIHDLLQGEEVDINHELSQLQSTRRGNGDDDDDETMEDAEGHGDRSQHHGGSGGAGPGATGGDVREEGEGSREGGADGARAPNDADAAVRNFLQSLQGNSSLGDAQGQEQGQRQGGDIAYPYLSHLLPNETTIPMLRNASEEYIDRLLGFLPPTILGLATESGDIGDAEPSADAAAAAIASLSVAEKKSLLEKVLRSPQFHQALGSLTMAIRDGGLPTISEALKIDVADRGFIRGAGMPLGGGRAVEAFVEGVKKTIEKEQGQ